MSTPPSTDTRWEGLREVLTMAWPIMLGSISFTLMDFADKYFVAQLGADDLAAVGSSSLWSYILGVFFLHLAACVSTFAAQSLGRGNKENCARYAWQGIYISVAAGLFAAALWPFIPGMFAAMDHSPAVTERETTYMQIRLLGYVFIAWQASLSSFFTAVGRPIVAMYATLVANVLNILFDWLLVFGLYGFPRMEIAGAAWATVGSLAVQTLILHALFLGPKMHAEYHTRTSFAIDMVKVREFLRIGWPSGVAAFMDVAAWGIFTSFIVGGQGRTMQLAAHTAALTFMHLSFIPVLGLNQATTAIVGQWIGRKQIAIAKARAYTAVKIGVAFMMTTALLGVFFGSEMISLMSDDPEIIRLGHLLLIFAGIFAGFDAISIVLLGALRGAGDTQWSMRVLIVGAFVFLLPMGYVFARPLGMDVAGAWVGATIYIIALSGVVLHRFHGERWKHIVIFEEDRPRTADDGVPVAPTVQGDPVAP